VDKKIFAREMLRLSTVFEKAPSKDLSAGYWDALQDSDDGEFVRAVNRHIREGEFFPRVKHLVDRMPAPERRDRQLFIPKLLTRAEQEENRRKAREAVGATTASTAMPNEPRVKTKDEVMVEIEEARRRLRQPGE